MVSAAFTITGIVLAAFHGPTWAWVACMVCALIAVVGEVVE